MKFTTENVQVRAPGCRVLIESESGNIILGDKNSQDLSREAGTHVQAATTNRRLDSPVSTADIELAPNDQIMNMIHPQDLVRIMFTEPRLDIWYPVFIGLVDSIRQPMNYGSRPSRSIQVSCSGMGKTLTRNAEFSDITMAQYLQFDKDGKIDIKKTGDYTQDRLSAYLRLKGDFSAAGKAMFQGSIKTQVKYLFELAFMVNTDFSLQWSGSKIGNILNVTDKIQGAVYDIMPPDLTNLSGTFWDVLSRQINDPWNEAFIEIYEDKGNYRPFLVIRETPFDHMESLTRWVVFPEEVKRRDLGSSDDEVVTAFDVRARYFSEDASILIPVQVVPETYRKYGMRIMSVESSAVPWGLRDKQPDDAELTEEQKRQSKDLYTELQFELMRWFKYNHMLLNGTSVVRMAPRIKIGDRLVFASDATGGGNVPEFYIQSVQHSYQFGQDASTTLGLVRGGYNLIEKGPRKTADRLSQEASIEEKKKMVAPDFPNAKRPPLWAIPMTGAR